MIRCSGCGKAGWEICPECFIEMKNKIKPSTMATGWPLFLIKVPEFIIPILRGE